MAFKIPSSGKPDPGKLSQHEGPNGYVYDDWRISGTAREKMIALWPELDLTWVDLAAREFESAWSKRGSNRDGFVGWRDDITSVATAAKRLRKALEASRVPARHSLGDHEASAGSASLHERASEMVEALITRTDELSSYASGVDARSLPHPMPDLVVKLALQLRLAGREWDKKFQPELTRLTSLTLDGLGLRHEIDIRSAVKDALRSGDPRVAKLR